MSAFVAFGCGATVNSSAKNTSNSPLRNATLLVRQAEAFAVVGALEAQIGNRPVARKHLVQVARELEKDPNVQFSVATFFREDMQDRIEADSDFRSYLALAPLGEHAPEGRGSNLGIPWAAS